MPGYTTILTVFGKSDPELDAIAQSIAPSTKKLKRIDNVFYIQVTVKTKFTKISADLDAQDLSYAYYFVQTNDEADLYTHGLDEDTVATLESIALP